MIQRDATIYLVFDYSEVDLRRYMDKTRRAGLTMNHIKVSIAQLLLPLPLPLPNQLLLLYRALCINY